MSNKTLLLCACFLLNAWIAGAQWHIKVNAGAGVFNEPHIDVNNLRSLSAIEGTRVVQSGYDFSNFLQWSAGRVSPKGQLMEAAFSYRAFDWQALSLQDRTGTKLGEYRQRTGELLLEYGWQRYPNPEKKRRSYLTVFSGFRYRKTALKGELPGVYNQYLEYGKVRVGIGTKLYLPMGKRVFLDLNTGVAFWSGGLEESFFDDPDIPGGITTRVFRSSSALETHARLGLGVRLGKIKRANGDLIPTN